jgi:hypothetical protein
VRRQLAWFELPPRFWLFRLCCIAAFGKHPVDGSSITRVDMY